MTIAEIEELEALREGSVSGKSQPIRAHNWDRYKNSLVDSAEDLIALAKWALSAKEAIERNIEGDYEYFLLDALKDFPGGANE